MVNKELNHLIRACANLQLVNPCSDEAHRMLYTIDSDTPFDVAFIDFWETGDIPDWHVSSKIITFLDCMT